MSLHRIALALERIAASLEKGDEASAAQADQVAALLEAQRTVAKASVAAIDIHRAELMDRARRHD